MLHSHSGPESESEAAPEPSAIESARVLLSAEAVDKGAMEDVLAKLEEQMEAVQAGVDAADARADAAETTTASAKDQVRARTSC
jgi:predicted  nucleic acid-binding Zn-ribbon protein